MLKKNTDTINLSIEGFGLIEVFIVLIIAGILATIAIPIYLNQVNKSRETEARQNLKEILNRQQEYLFLVAIFLQIGKI